MPRVVCGENSVGACTCVSVRATARDKNYSGNQENIRYLS